MSEALELRLVSLAQKVADMYKNEIEEKYYKEMCNAINVCHEYYLNEKYNWDKMCEMQENVLGEDGIWNYADCEFFEEEIQNMWVLVTDILLCNCYMGCEDIGDSIPQDMEIRGENIPDFIELLEGLVCNRIDYDRIFEFWDEEMCY